MPWSVNMAELPASWGLKKRKRSDGKLDIIGKTDHGEEYRVRTTDTSEITERDVQELRAADRESYSNPETRTRDFVKHLTAPSPRKQAEEAREMDEWIADADRVCYAGFEKRGSTLGSTRSYRENYDKIDWRN